MNAYGDIEQTPYNDRIDPFGTIDIRRPADQNNTFKWPWSKSHPEERGNWGVLLNANVEVGNAPAPIRYTTMPREMAQGGPIMPMPSPDRNDPVAQTLTKIPSQDEDSMLANPYVKYGAGVLAVYVVYRMLRK